MWRTTSISVAFARLAEDWSGTFLRFSPQIELPYMCVFLFPTTILFQDSNILGKDTEIKELYSFCFTPQFHCLWRILSFSGRWRIFTDLLHLLQELENSIKINSKPYCFRKHLLPKLCYETIWSLSTEILACFSFWMLRGNSKPHISVLKVELVHKAWYHSKIRNIFTFQISSKFCVWYIRGIWKKITSNF